MSTLVTTIHLITCVLISIVVLLQSGKGAEISASFGGSSQTVFGSSGGANFFTRLTLTLAAIFMTTSLTLTWMSNKGRKSVFDGMTAPISTGTTAPGTTVPGTTAPATTTGAPTAASVSNTSEATASGEKAAPGKTADAADIRGQGVKETAPAAVPNTAAPAPKN